MTDDRRAMKSEYPFTPPRVNDFGTGLIAVHDQPCHVCSQRKAVYELGTGIFSPCWECQREGWQLVQKRGWAFWRKKT